MYGRKYLNPALITLGSLLLVAGITVVVPTVARTGFVLALLVVGFQQLTRHEMDPDFGTMCLVGRGCSV
jgi:hypothetical protein